MNPTILTVQDIMPRLIGLGQFRIAASAEGYDDAYINSSIVPQAIRAFENDAKFRVSPIRVVTDDDGTFTTGYTGTVLHRDMQPYNYVQSRFFLRFQALEWPIREVLRFRVELSRGHPIVTFPLDWVHFETRTGYVWIQPVTGHVTSAASATVAWNILENFRHGKFDSLPQSIALDYEAGLPDGWQSDPEWADVFRALTARAARMILSDWSQTFDAGITQKSITGLGINTSVQMTRFADRIAALAAEEREIVETLKGNSVPIMIGSV